MVDYYAINDTMTQLDDGVPAEFRRLSQESKPTFAHAIYAFGVARGRFAIDLMQRIALYAYLPMFVRNLSFRDHAAARTTSIDHIFPLFI